MMIGRNDRCLCGSGLKYKKCCEMRDQEVAAAARNGQLSTILRVKVWTPSQNSEQAMRQEIEAHTRTSWQPGSYSDPHVISKFLRSLFDKCDEIIYRELHAVCSWTVLDFTLAQHDQWTRLFWAWRYGRPTVSRELEEELQEKTPGMRRALKHVAENVASMRPQLKPWASGTLRCIERALVAAEQSFMFSQLSDQTYRLFPDDTTLKITEPGSDFYFTLELGDLASAKIDRHHARQYRWEILGDTKFRGLLNDSDGENLLASIRQFLKEPFQRNLGYTADDVVTVVKMLRDNTAIGGGFLVPTVPRSAAISAIVEATGLSGQIVSSILQMFILDSTALGTEPPEIRRSKRLNRLNRRPFIELGIPTDPVLMWSNCAVTEALGLVWLDCAKRKLQPEIAAVPDLMQHIQELHDQENARLEAGTLEELVKRGFCGRIGVKSGSLSSDSGERLLIPADVGEIDLLCVHPEHHVLLVGECKNAAFAPEPTLMYEDLQDFVLGHGKRASYREKFLRKIRWVENNKIDLIGALVAENEALSGQGWTIVAVMVTNYASVVSEFIDEFPCVPLCIFLDDYDSSGGWPY